MFRFLLCCCIVSVFAALPVLGDNAQGYDIKNSEYNGQEEILASFKFTNGDGITPFVMQITFANCSKLKDERFGNTISLTSFRLRYKNINEVWVTPPISLTLNCLNTIEFSTTRNNLQASYEFELLGSWNKQNAERIAGTFKESMSIEILPHP